MKLKMYAHRRYDVEQKSYQGDDERYSVRITTGRKQVDGIQYDHVTSVTEKVMEWQDASHIHEWFIANADAGTKESKSGRICKYELRKLLELCEKVLNASHLVRKEPFSARDYFGMKRRMEPQRESTLYIKNIVIANKLLPVKDVKDGKGLYDEAYLRDVQATRDWVEQTLMDLEKDGSINFDIIYSWGYGM